MIIFDLDCLANDTHRRHYIEDPLDCVHCYTAVKFGGDAISDDFQCHFCKRFPLRWKYDLEAYNAACEDDVPIIPTLQVLYEICRACICPITLKRLKDVQVWSCRSHSEYGKTLNWLGDQGISEGKELSLIKMRPDGNTEPAWELKRRWLDDCIIEKELYNTLKIDFVFESDPESIAMFRRHGIFCFDCRQL